MALQLSTVTKRKVWHNTRTCYRHGTEVRAVAHRCYQVVVRDLFWIASFWTGASPGPQIVLSPGGLLYN